MNEQIKAKTLFLANGSMNVELQSQNSKKERTKQKLFNISNSRNTGKMNRTESIPKSLS